jgi:hypothetical protein
MGTNCSVTHGKEHLNEYPCSELLETASTVTYLYHESKTIEFEHTNGRRIRFTVFGSPYSKQKSYVTAFNYTNDEATTLWSTIPLDTDIVLTHTPAKYHCDESFSDVAARCSVLREVFWRVRPRLAICGHEHKGRGAEVVTWDLDTKHVRFKEIGVHHLVPAMNLVKSDLPVIDLTNKGNRPLANDSVIGNLIPEPGSSPKRGWEVDPHQAAMYYNKKGKDENREIDDANDFRSITVDMDHDLVDRAWQILSWDIETRNFSPPSAQIPAFHSMGGKIYGLMDHEAISGREGRRETCIINGAYMPVDQAVNAAGSVRNSNPIVVDIEFPVVVPDDEYYTREALTGLQLE